MSPKRFYLSTKNVTQLIKEVKQRPCLWNPEDEEYAARYPLTRAWEDISFELDLPATFLRTKWKNLRDTYKKELNKFPDGYAGSWRHFDALSFLVFRTEGNDNSENDAPDKDSEDESEESNDSKSKLLWNDDPIPDKKKKNRIDYNVLFLRSLTPYFRQLEPLRKLTIRSKMQDMLLNEIAAQNTNSRSSIFD